MGRKSDTSFTPAAEVVNGSAGAKRMEGEVIWHYVTMAAIAVRWRCLLL